ncbi:MAG TPA: contractile injection system tape measure protein, partial [Rhodocyclaceae bacterium]
LDGLKLLLGASSGVVERLLVELNGPTEGALRQRLWADTLTYLQRQGAATFDAANYLAALRTHWREAGQAGTASAETAETAETAALLAALARIDQAAAEVGSAAPSAAEAAYARIVQRLAGRTQQDITADIVKLAKSHPELLRQLQQQLRQGEASAAAARTLGAQEAKQLVMALLALEGTAAAAEFRREIERQATEAWSEGRYYRHILSRLVSGGEVDLQLAAEAPLAADDDLDATDASASPAEGRGRYEQLLLRLLRRLRGESGAAEMAAEIEELAAGAPQALKQLYRKLQSGELRPVLDGLTARECAPLLEAFLRPERGPELTELLREVRAYAARSRDLAAYYRRVLGMLIGGRLVDLAAAANAAPEAGTVRPVPAATDVPPPAAPPRPPEARSIFSKLASEPVDDEAPTEEIYVANAGMVLVAPYFPRLFSMLELTEGGKFKDERAMERAIHLLQYAVNGSCDSPEFLLVLNKILCGAPAAFPIARCIELEERERQAVEGMLQAVIHNWKIIGKTSVQGLQGSFLQRMGRLQLKGDDWYLKVESKGIDVLLDQLPWSISIIRYPWMKRMVFVEWR